MQMLVIEWSAHSYLIKIFEARIKKFYLHDSNDYGSREMQSLPGPICKISLHPVKIAICYSLPGNGLTERGSRVFATPMIKWDTPLVVSLKCMYLCSSSTDEWSPVKTNRRVFRNMQQIRYYIGDNYTATGGAFNIGFGCWIVHHLFKIFKFIIRKILSGYRFNMNFGVWYGSAWQFCLVLPILALSTLFLRYIVHARSNHYSHICKMHLTSGRFANCCALCIMYVE